MGRAYNELLWEEARALQARAQARRENASAMQEEAGARRRLFATERDTLPPPPQGLVGPDGRPATAASTFGTTAATAPGQQTATVAPPVSTGQGGGPPGRGGSFTGPRIFLSRRGLFAKPEEWVKAHGIPIPDYKIPDPKGPGLRMVSVLAWDCTALLGPEAIFIDPDALRALQPAPISAKSGGGHTGAGAPRPEFNTLEGITTGPHPVHGGLPSSSSSSSSTGPAPTERLRPVLEEQTAILRELRDQGRRETGSLARRAGGRP